MVARSSLEEITVQVRDFIFKCLSESLPNLFDSPNKVIITTLVDEETDKYEYQKRNSEQIEYPFACVTRQSDIKGIMGGTSIPSVNHAKTEYYDRSDVGENQVPVWNLIPVVLSYHVRVYSSSFKDLELLSEKIMFMMGERHTHSWISEYLSVPDKEFESRVTITYDESPVLATIPDMNEKTSGKGYVYVLNFAPNVSGILGRSKMRPTLRQINIRGRDEDENEFIYFQKDVDVSA
jgi:hypothetical protein